MKTIHKFTTSVITITLLLSIASCAGMTPREKNTAIGAGVGAVAGNVISGGTTAGTVGGAAVGGIIGHNVR
ncbi:MAG: glycine zipper 2TM domain-containing protein [Thiothrix sp.]|uniref:glycine zipper 2TM domain-containing protein n=1 Tax=Thiothrix sp. TaxID=1032 RepID=UPI0026240E45|nr:glycine zipper 2TM domain-containing protein [Thiothrix sp.]MDD5394145.1 glycine zipper 2TM domain-containing protein [Thiothrix sp.]